MNTPVRGQGVDYTESDAAIYQRSLPLHPYLVPTEALGTLIVLMKRNLLPFFLSASCMSLLWSEPEALCSAVSERVSE